MYLPPLDEILDRDVLCVPPETPLLQLLGDMSCLEEGGSCTLDKSVHSCALILEGDRLVGIFTERDLVRLTAQEYDASQASVAEVMTRDPIVLREDAYQDIFSIVALLRQHRIRHLPLVSAEGRVLGVFSQDRLRKSLRPENLLRLRSVSEVMNQNVVSVSPEASVLDGVRQMVSAHTSCVAICDRVGDRTVPLGILTERDIVQYRVLGLDFQQNRALEVASQPPLCVRPQDSLWTAYQLMETRRVRRLFVTTAEGALLGLVTQTTLLNALTPLGLHEVIEALEKRVSSLESEKLQLLQQQKQKLETQVRQRTQQVRQHATNARLLADLAAHIRESLEVDRILNTTVSEVRQILGCDRAVISQFQPDDTIEIVAEARIEGIDAMLGHSFCKSEIPPALLQITADPPTAVHVFDDIEDASLPPEPRQNLQNYQIQATLSVSLFQGDRPWGLLCVHQSQPRHWDKREIDLLSQLSLQLAIALQQAQLYQQSQQELRERQQAEERARELNLQLSRTNAILQQERHFLSTVFSVSGALLLVLDPQGNIVQFNPTCERLTGYRSEELVGTSVWERLIPPEQIPKVQEIFQTLMATQAPSQHENDWVCRQGQRYRIAWSNAVITDKAGNVQYVVASGLDISDRQRMEAQLRQSEERFRQIAETIREVFYVCDLRQPEILYISPAYEEVWQRSRQSLYDNLLSFTDSIFECDRPRVLDALERQKQGQATTLEYRLLRSDGSVRWILDRSFPLTEASGQAYRVIGIAEDITTRKLTQLRLQESQRRYATLTEAAPVGIFRTDAAGENTYANERWYQMTGLTPQTVLDRGWQAAIPPEDRDRIVRQWQQCVRQRQPYRSELRFRRPNGSDVWVSAQAIPEIDEAGELLGYLGTVSDITSRKLAEEQLLRKVRSEKLLHQTAQHIRRTLKLDRILTTTVEEVRQILHCDRVLVYRFNPDRSGRIVAESVAAGITSTIDRQFSDPCLQGEKGEYYRQGHHTFIADVQTSPQLTECHRQLLNELEVRANLVMPILLRSNDTQAPTESSLWGLLIAHHCRHAYPWNLDEIQLLEEISLQLSIAIQQAQLYSQIQAELNERRKAETALRELNEDLETRVQQRTLELGRRDRYLSGLVEIQRHLIASDDVRSCYEDILAILGEMSDASRVYLFETHPDDDSTLLVSQRAEWCAEGIASQLDNPDLQNFPLEALPHTAARLRTGRDFSGNVAQMPQAERSVLEPQGIFSISLVPISVALGAHLLGFIGFDRCDRTEPWTDLEVQLLQSAARSISLAKERQNAEIALRESRERFRTLLESLREIVFQVDREGRWTFLNAAWENIIGLPVNNRLGQPLAASLHPSERQKVAEQFQALQAAADGGDVTGSFQASLRFLRENGSVCWLEMDANAICDATGTCIGISGTLNDISDRKFAEEERDRTQQRLELALDASSQAVWEWDLDTNEAFWSLQAYAMLGYEPNEFPMSFDNWQALLHPDDRQNILPKMLVDLQQNQSYCYALRHRAKSGEWRWIEGSAKIYPDRDGSQRVIGINVDITDRKHSEMQLKDSLRQKEILLKEIHHRVKNNLLVVTSLLDLQAMQVSEDSVLKVLKESKNRVLSMALIHEKLYSSPDLSRVNFRDYLESLVNTLFTSYQARSSKIQHQVFAETIFLNIETANPCGLIVNELISNIVKHAFPEGESGRVEVRLSRNDENTICLTVSDDGVGIPEEIDIHKTTSLGIQLVTLLSRQIRATVELKRDGGTTFTISFQELHYKQRV